MVGWRTYDQVGTRSKKILNLMAALSPLREQLEAHVSEVTEIASYAAPYAAPYHLLTILNPRDRRQGHSGPRWHMKGPVATSAILPSFVAYACIP